MITTKDIACLTCKIVWHGGRTLYVDDLPKEHKGHEIVGPYAHRLCTYEKDGHLWQEGYCHYTYVSEDDLKNDFKATDHIFIKDYSSFERVDL